MFTTWIYGRDDAFDSSIIGDVIHVTDSPHTPSGGA